MSSEGSSRPAPHCCEPVARFPQVLFGPARPPVTAEALSLGKGVTPTQWGSKRTRGRQLRHGDEDIHSASRVRGGREADRNEAEKGPRLQAAESSPGVCTATRGWVGGSWYNALAVQEAACLPVSLRSPHTLGRRHRGHSSSLSQTLAVTELSALPSCGKDSVLLVVWARRVGDRAGRHPGTACPRSPGLSRRPREPDAGGEAGEAGQGPSRLVPLNPPGAAGGSVSTAPTAACV